MGEVCCGYYNGQFNAYTGVVSCVPSGQCKSPTPCNGGSGFYAICDQNNGNGTCPSGKACTNDEPLLGGGHYGWCCN